MVDSDSFLFKWFDHISSEGSFNSGMDDFPRPNGIKYHVDAQCWMYKLTEFMWKASVKFENAISDDYLIQMNKIKENLKVFLDPSRNIFVDAFDANSKTYSEHVGYGSLLPIAFGMLKPNTLEFNATLNLITDPRMLNTSHGLSSIQITSPRYLASRDAYWRGPVWINMNYVVLRGLKVYYSTDQNSLW
jgi:mannosyl-oligosaccharide glucosidase